MTERKQLLRAIKALDAGRIAEAARIAYGVSLTLTMKVMGHGSGGEDHPSLYSVGTWYSIDCAKKKISSQPDTPAG